MMLRTVGKRFFCYYSLSKGIGGVFLVWVESLRRRRRFVFCFVAHC